MPVKNYVSRNGQVEYEYDDLGSILTYGRDALGNVVAGYDAATNAVFTADYKPYGEFAATTGNVAGRRFMWVGSWGYRFTSGVPVSHYVRARHLSMRMGMWTSVDPLWPTEAAFGYVGGGATRAVDPSGLQSKPIWAAKLETRGPCKRYHVFDCSVDIDRSMGRPRVTPQHPIRNSSPWMLLGKYQHLQEALRKCGISHEAIMQMVCEESCCSVAKTFGADPYAICALAVTERTTRNISNPIQDATAAFGRPVGQSFGCLQIQIQRARYVIAMAKHCDLIASTFLAPLTTQSTNAEIAAQLVNCEYSLKLASIEQKLRSMRCDKTLAPILPNDPVRNRKKYDYSMGLGFAISWNADSTRHVNRVSCAYSAMAAAGLCE